jgi:transcriptional regulator with XRE-family HTH domain
MSGSSTSRRARIAALSRRLRNRGFTWGQIGAQIGREERVNVRVAMRLAHGYTQTEVARLWNVRWPSKSGRAGISDKNVSYWETWPESGHEPSLETYKRLAQLYECDVGDLIEDDEGRLDAKMPTAGPLLPYTELADSEYLQSLREQIEHIVKLENRFGGSDLASLAIRIFRSTHRQLGTGKYQDAIERDLHSMVGELAELSGWLLYDADRQLDVRRMNQEALYFSRLAGDRNMELFAVQNSSMHAGYLGRPREALNLAESVLDGGNRLTPRVKTLFLVRRARALAQMGDENAVQLLKVARSRFDDGIGNDDPPWAWWIDERELAWHEGMAQLDLSRPAVALDLFERAVAATEATQVRDRYLHLAYLLLAQTQVEAWDDARATLRELLPLAGEVASQRTVVLIDKSLPRLRDSRVPAETRDAAGQLEQLLTVSLYM